MIKALYDCPDPQDCDTPVLPTVEFDPCSPEAYYLSEISHLYVSVEDPANAGVPLTGTVDWSDLAAIDTAFDGTNGIVLTGIGDMPAADEDTRQISNGRTVIGERTFTLNFTIDEANAANYEAFRSFQMGGKYIIWPLTRGGKLFGGGDGILCNVSSATNPLERGEGNYEVYNISFQWKKQCSPPQEVHAASEYAPEEGV